MFDSSASNANAVSSHHRARQADLHRYVVTAEQMSQIEARVFAAGMPVAALMEKVGGLLVQWVCARYALPDFKRIGILVGPGHNGGDALVMARELHFRGYEVIRYQPFSKLKELTQSHAQYADSLGIAVTNELHPLQNCDLIIDGLFGFGLTRPLAGEIAEAVDLLNSWRNPVISIDLPSGVHTDTGAVLGTAVRATQTLCLGLWKRAFLQDSGLDYVGQADLIDFGLPLADVRAVLGESPVLQRLTSEMAIQALPLPRPAATHKYKQGHLLLIAGSRQYMGAAILAGLSARSSGVGMLSIAVPESLRSLLIAQLPDALVIGCLEDETGAIAALPDSVDLAKYQAIACGPGLTLQALPVVKQVLSCACPLLLDADGLNSLATLDAIVTLRQRSAPTVLTPHWGEFKRLFPALTASSDDRIQLVQTAAQQTGAIVLLKGAKTAIAAPQGQVWLVPESTPALARGGSGDVLTGLTGGLLAQRNLYGAALEAVVSSAAWWHAQAGVLAVQERSELGVDASTLIHYLPAALMLYLNQAQSSSQAIQ